MALSKTTGTSASDAANRVDWPELPALGTLKSDEAQALREWYSNMRQSVDRTLATLTRAIEDK